MSAEVIVALITGIVTIITVLVNSVIASKEMNAKLDKAQAVTQTRLDDLTREVREHNEYGKRIPILEEKMKVANHRIDKLENKEEKVS